MKPYSDADHYDEMVERHCFPTTEDDGEDLQLSPRTARTEHFTNVAATYPPRRPAGRPAYSPASHVEPVAGLSSPTGARRSLSGARSGEPS